MVACYYEKDDTIVFEKLVLDPPYQSPDKSTNQL